MAKPRGLLALAGAAAGMGAGFVVQRSVVNRRRKADPARDEAFGTRRGVRGRRITLGDGARLFIEEAGPPSTRGAIFIHGSALRTDVWHYQMEGIGDHRLVFFDLRGHGLSRPKGDSEYSIATLARDVEAVIEDAGLEEVVLVGHSIGGMIALELCRARGDSLGSLIKGLVLANTTYRPAVETLAGGAAVARIERLARRPLDFVGSHSERLERLRKIIRPSDAIFWGVSFAAFGPGASAKQVDFSYDMLAETPADIIFDLIKSYRDFDVRDVLGEIDVPALVIGGTEDRLTIGEAAEYLAEHLPDAELRLLPGCGHMAMLERHHEFNAMVGSFLDDVFGVAQRERSAGEGS